MKQRLTTTRSIPASWWAYISVWGSRIRTSGESLEFGMAPVELYEKELDVVDTAVRKIREKLAEVKNDG